MNLYNFFIEVNNKEEAIKIILILNVYNIRHHSVDYQRILNSEIKFPCFLFRVHEKLNIFTGDEYKINNSSFKRIAIESILQL